MCCYIAWLFWKYTDKNISTLDKTEPSEAKRNSSGHETSATFVQNVNQRHEGSTHKPVLDITNDLQAEGLIMTKPDKEHISTASKIIASLTCDTETEKVDHMQAGSSYNLWLDNSASSTNIESSTNIKEIKKNTEENYVEMEQEVLFVYCLFVKII